MKAAIGRVSIFMLVVATYPISVSACEACRARAGGVYAEAEALVGSYFRQDGTKVGSDPLEQVQPDFVATPRLTLGYQTCEGMGLRLQWFESTQSHNSVGGLPTEILSLDTFNLDLEAYDTVTLNHNWSLEVSGGVRLNNFDERMRDDADLRRNTFNGLGMIVGLEARRELPIGRLYIGSQGSVVLGDKSRQNDSNPGRFSDHLTQIWEFRTGWEGTRCLSNGSIAFMRLGGELQAWENFSSEFLGLPLAPNAQNENVWGGHSDVGFGMLTLSIGWRQ